MTLGIDKWVEKKVAQLGYTNPSDIEFASLRLREIKQQYPEISDNCNCLECIEKITKKIGKDSPADTTGISEKYKHYLPLTGRMFNELTNILSKLDVTIEEPRAYGNQLLEDMFIELGKPLTQMELFLKVYELKKTKDNRMIGSTYAQFTLDNQGNYLSLFENFKSNLNPDDDKIKGRERRIIVEDMGFGLPLSNTDIFHKLYLKEDGVVKHFFAKYLMIGDREFIFLLDFFKPKKITIFDDPYLKNCVENSVNLFASQAALLEKNIKLTENAKYAIVEPKTGLHTELFYLKHLRKALYSALRHEKELSVLLIDLDNFSAFNDVNDYCTGDMVLIKVSNTLKESVRETDIASRVGGEEFTIILDSTNKEGGLNAAETIRRLVESIPSEIAAVTMFHDKSQKQYFKGKSLLPVTASIAVVSLDEILEMMPIENSKKITEDTIKIIEHKIKEKLTARLHVAKKGGRNRVV